MPLEEDAEALLGLAEPAAGDQHPARGVEGEGRLGVEGESQARLVLGGVESALIEETQGEEPVGVGMVGVEGQGAAQRLDGSRQLPPSDLLLGQRQPALDVRVAHPRTHFQKVGSAASAPERRNRAAKTISAPFLTGPPKYR